MTARFSESLYRAFVSGLTLAVAALVLASSIELHDSAREHAALGSSTEISVDASHAGSKAHFERSEVVVVSHCPECLLRSQSAGKLAAPVANVLGAAPQQRLIAAPEDLPPSAALERLLPSRAPPLA